MKVHPKGEEGMELSTLKKTKHVPFFPARRRGRGHRHSRSYSQVSRDSERELCGYLVPVAPPADEDLESLYSGPAPARWEDRDCDAPLQRRTQREEAMLGAVNINASLFHDGNYSMIFCPKPSPSPSDCTLTGGAPAANADGGGARRLLNPNNAGEEEHSRRPRQGSTSGPPEYFTKAFVEMFLKGEEVDEFMKEVDLAGI